MFEFENKAFAPYFHSAWNLDSYLWGVGEEICVQSVVLFYLIGESRKQMMC